MSGFSYIGTSYQFYMLRGTLDVLSLCLFGFIPQSVFNVPTLGVNEQIGVVVELVKWRLISIPSSCLKIYKENIN